MISNDQELDATKERVAYFYRLMAQLRVSSAPDEYPFIAGGYRAEIARMQNEILDYLTRHASETTPAEAA